MDGGTATSQNFSYDANGAEAGTSTASGTSANGWNFEGKLTQTALSDSSGHAAGGSANVFDAAGDRLAHTDDLGKTGQKTTSYLVDTDTSYSQVIEERAPDVSDAAGAPNLQARYVWGEGLAPLAMWRKMPDGSVKLFFHLSDGQESVRQLTDAAGAVVDAYFYDAWGNTLDGSSNHVVNPFRYTGQQLDADGKYYLRARFYNPGTGRFLSHDPLMGSSDNPASLHRYLYAGADGVNRCDPTGKWSLGETLVTMGVNAELVSFGATAINVASKVAVAGSAYNIYADYSSGAAVDPWDIVNVATASLPLFSKALKIARSGISGVGAVEKFTSFFTASKIVNFLSRSLGGTSSLYETVTHHVHDMAALEAGVEQLEAHYESVVKLVENQPLAEDYAKVTFGGEKYLVEIDNASHKGMNIVDDYGEVVTKNSLRADILDSKAEEYLHIQQYEELVENGDIPEGGLPTIQQGIQMEREVCELLAEIGVTKQIVA